VSAAKRVTDAGCGTISGAGDSEAGCRNLARKCLPNPRLFGPPPPPAKEPAGSWLAERAGGNRLAGGSVEEGEAERALGFVHAARLAFEPWPEADSAGAGEAEVKTEPGFDGSPSMSQTPLPGWAGGGMDDEDGGAEVVDADFPFVSSTLGASPKGGFIACGRRSGLSGGGVSDPSVMASGERDLWSGAGRSFTKAGDRKT